MSDHPPIPPHCPHFEVVHNDSVTRFILPERAAFIVLRAPQVFTHRMIRNIALWRPVIAAVSEVAWMKEARRLYVEWHNRVHTLTGDEIVTACDAIDNATSNADAWRAWGEK